jgi:hypothetical protein
MATAVFINRLEPAHGKRDALIGLRSRRTAADLRSGPQQLTTPLTALTTAVRTGSKLPQPPR